MATQTYPLLSALMAPCTAAEFLARYWPRQSFVTHGDPNRFPAPLRHEALSSATALAQRYRGSLRFTRGRTSEQMIQIDRVSPVLLQEMELTLQFEDIVPYVPGTREFLQQLELELGVHEKSLYLSAFASPREDGLKCHYDAHDLISIQLHGTKRFHYSPMLEIRNPYGSQYVPNARPYDDLYPQAAGGFPDDPRDAAFEAADMRPGSVLFLPRGTWHHTEASEQSLSLSIMINPPAAFECLLEQLRLLLLQDSDWRQPLYGAHGEDGQYQAARAQSAALLGKLPSLIAQLSAHDLVHALMPADARLKQINPDSRFQKAPNAGIEFKPPSPLSGLPVVAILVSDTPGQSQVSARIEISSKAVPLFRWLAQRASPFSAATLHRIAPGFSFAEIKNMLIASTQAQLLKMLWFAPLAAKTEAGEVGQDARSVNSVASGQ